jgi:hypothetical protein
MMRSEAIRVALRQVAGRLEAAAGRMDTALIEPEWEIAENELALVRLEMQRLEALVQGTTQPERTP